MQKVFLASLEARELNKIKQVLNEFEVNIKSMVNANLLNSVINEPQSIIISDLKHSEIIETINIQENSQYMFYVDRDVLKETKIRDNIYAFANYEQLKIWLNIFLNAGEPALSGIQEYKKGNGIDSNVTKNVKDSPRKNDNNERVEKKSKCKFIAADYEWQKKEDPSEKYNERLALIRRRVLSQGGWDHNRTIAVWSPFDRIGVTTFVMNFAIYLGKMKVSTAVLEGVSTTIRMKTILKHWKAVPTNWNSFINTVYDESISPEQAKLNYKGVQWLPYDYPDIKKYHFDYEVPEYIITNLVNAAKYYDYLFIDLANGRINSPNIVKLNNADDLWVIVDGDEFGLKRWRKYISDLSKKYNLNVKIIFVKDYPFINHKNIVELLGFDEIARIPDLTEPLYKNMLKDKPFIETQEGMQHLNKSFNEISEYILGRKVKNNKNLLLSNLYNWFE